MAFDETSLPPQSDLKRLIDRYGARAVALAFLRAAIARRRHPPPPARLSPDRLSPHLRRDIGLPPEDGGRPFR